MLHCFIIANSAKHYVPTVYLNWIVAYYEYIMKGFGPSLLYVGVLYVLNSHRILKGMLSSVTSFPKDLFCFLIEKHLVF